MGALHEGHASLVRQGAALARDLGAWGCVVTVFVNPTQFNDPADFARYPKTLDVDLAICQGAGAAGVFVPGVEEVYPRGREEGVPVLPAVATRPGLEDRHRPGHFAGVCQVVKRLFEMTRPRAAVFGEKDWQQLQVVRAMTGMLGLGVEIVAGPTVRESDGLAMSSRNRFLGPADRRRATALSRGLRAALGASTPDEAERVMGEVLGSEGVEAEYAVIREAETLTRPAESVGARWRALVAARVGSVRLIDNGAWRPAGEGGVRAGRE
ncbi:pantoate--beta-alanine ligase [Phycisphaerales bacterium]|nr:pantoate--beta-alanine ligase [Phycisphaerales bacterium]